MRYSSFEENDIVIENFTGNKDIIYVNKLTHIQLYTLLPILYIYIYRSL